jgi:hypothetical protein
MPMIGTSWKTGSWKDIQAWAFTAWKEGAWDSDVWCKGGWKERSWADLPIRIAVSGKRFGGGARGYEDDKFKYLMQAYYEEEEIILFVVMAVQSGIIDEL